MRPDRSVLVAKTRTKKNLQENHARVEYRKRVDGNPVVVFQNFMRFSPPFARKYCQAQNRAKHDLRKARVQHWQPVMEQTPYHFAAENGLRDNTTHRGYGKPTQPPP